MEKHNKKGMVDGHVSYLIGALILIVLIVALAPTFFSGLGSTGATALGNTTANPNAPSWLPTVMVVIVGAGLVLIVWRIIGGRK